jgi:hypothetical protein
MGSFPTVRCSLCAGKAGDLAWFNILLPDNFNVCVKGDGFYQNQINVAGILRSGAGSYLRILETMI